MFLHTAKILIAAAAVALLAACGGGADGPSTPPPPPNVQLPPPQGQPFPVLPITYPAGEFQAEVLRLINEARAQNGLVPLLADARLTIAASGHIQYIVCNRDDPAVWGHGQTPGRPCFTGVQPSDRARAAGYLPMVGEVMAGGVTPQEHVNALLASPPHRAILLDVGVRHIGISDPSGVIKLSSGIVY
jgi:uncharacterized protein YkwD